MKIVQSCWSCRYENFLNFGAGWCAPEYHMMGWALSCLQLRKYYDDVTLYADDVTAAFLIDELRLPYTEVVCSLNELNQYDSKLWALPKIHTYSKQTIPFLHVDGDVFIFKPFSNDLLKNDLIAQNLEFSPEFYDKHIKKLELLVSYLPVEISEIRGSEKEIRSYNAGILGGNDIDFFKEYTKKAFECVKKNKNQFLKIDLGVFNIFFEQCLFYALVKKRNKSVGVEIPEIVGDTLYVGLGDFHEVPFNRQYLHLLGNFKRNKLICDQMAKRLRLDYPEFYYRIIALIKENKLPLEKDYYHFLDLHTEEHLLKRYCTLKADDTTLPCNSPITSGHQLENDFRTTLRNQICVTIKNKYLHLNTETLNLILEDIDLFSKKLDDIFLYKFNRYAKEDLYKRDINQAKQGQLIFEDNNKGFERKLVKTPFLEIVECRYNWYEVYYGCLSNDKLTLPLNTEAATIYIGIVPECTTSAYSLVSIDDFDYSILEILETPCSVNQLITAIKKYMEPEVIEYSLSELENLLFNRIKVALKNKIIEGYNA